MGGGTVIERGGGRRSGKVPCLRVDMVSWYPAIPMSRGVPKCVVVGRFLQQSIYCIKKHVRFLVDYVVLVGNGLDIAVRQFSLLRLVALNGSYFQIFMLAA